MKIGAIIQARMGSTRLSGKVMKKLQGKTVLSHVIERVKQSKYIKTIVIATTVNDSDKIIEREAHRCHVEVFRGSEEDVLSRYYNAAKEFELDLIIRITSDCPLIDPHIIDEMVKYYLGGQHGIVTNAGSDLKNRTYPRGLDTEIFSFEWLEKAYYNAKEKYQREHVTPYIYEYCENIYYYKDQENNANHRWTLDTKEDFYLIEEIYKRLYNGKHDFYISDILGVFVENPELIEINRHIEQKKLKK